MCKFHQDLALSVMLSLTIFIFPCSVNAQTPGQVTVQQSGDSLVICFTINAGRPGDLCRVQLLASSDGGLTFNMKPRMVRGIDRLLKVGQLQKLTWAPLAENVELDGDKFVFDVVGEIVVISDQVEFVTVAGSMFFMGDTSVCADADEGPPHVVSVRDFEIGQYEVTNRQYLKFLNEYRSDEVKSGEYEGEHLVYQTESQLHKQGSHWVVEPQCEDLPVRNVTWYGANEYCRYYGYRLPTEAEWEYAARVGGKQVKYGNGKGVADPEDINFSVGNDTLEVISLENRNRKAPTRVGIFPPNGMGLYDMSGNVWEWCQDWYSDTYYQVLVGESGIAASGPWFGNFKVIRGGGFGNDARGIRTTERSFMPPWSRNIDVGFRAVHVELSTHPVME